MSLAVVAELHKKNQVWEENSGQWFFNVSIFIFLFLLESCLVLIALKKFYESCLHMVSGLPKIMN